MNTARTTLLLIEDDPQIQHFLSIALEAHEYTLEVADTGNVGLRLAALRKPDIAIVDLGLPDISGLEVIRRLREWYTRPILVLSARTEESEKVAALDLGADDYVTKPFGIDELLARLRVAQRHLANSNGAEARIEFAGYALDFGARRLRRDGTDVHLTPIEYKLLTALVRHRGKVLTRRQLLLEVWGPDHIESAHYLRTYMRALRHKIEPDPARPRYLLTDVGVGYRFADS